MKRFILTVAMLLTALAFVGCGKKTTMESAKANLDSAFECDMKMVYEDTEFGGRLKRIESGVWEASFTSPDSLDGLVLSFSGNDASASYKGLSFTVPKKALPVKSILTNLMTAVDTLAEGDELSGHEEDGMMKITGENETGEYVLDIDMKTGFISLFEMKNLGVTMSFENAVTGTADYKLGETAAESFTTEPCEPVTEIVTTIAS